MGKKRCQQQMDSGPARPSPAAASPLHTSPSLPAASSPHALPAGFIWERKWQPGTGWWLLRESDRVVMASVCRRLDGQWIARIDRHLLRDRGAVAPTERRAVAWVSMWVRARASKLLQAPKEYLPGQSPPLRTWRTGWRQTD